MLKQPISLIRGLILVLAFSFLPVVALGESLDSFNAVIHPSGASNRKRTALLRFTVPTK
ncbi:hypothetical protein ABW365_14220 [Enterococcus avium]